jgi:hypothetical protein
MFHDILSMPLPESCFLGCCVCCVQDPAAQQCVFRLEHVASHPAPSAGVQDADTGAMLQLLDAGKSARAAAAAVAAAQQAVAGGHVASVDLLVGCCNSEVSAWLGCQSLCIAWLTG